MFCTNHDKPGPNEQNKNLLYIRNAATFKFVTYFMVFISFHISWVTGMRRTNLVLARESRLQLRTSCLLFAGPDLPTRHHLFITFAFIAVLVFSAGTATVPCLLRVFLKPSFKEFIGKM